MTRTRQALLAGASAMALALSAPAGMAADLPTKAPPPASAPPSAWTWWLEGGAQVLRGDPFIAGLIPVFDAPPSRLGGDIAGSFDYRFLLVWHIISDFRFGMNGPRHSANFQNGCISSCTPISGPNSATRRETNWDVDIMLGRDVGLGQGSAQIEGGLRMPKSGEEPPAT